jgi:hypothetical protein
LKIEIGSKQGRYCRRAWYLPKSKNRVLRSQKKLNAIDSRNEAEKGLRQPFDSPFEWRLDLCLQQNSHAGVG